jgi:hypothetical protein
VRRVRPEAASHLARWEHRPRLAQQAGARRVVPAVLWGWLSERPHSAASPVRQAAAAHSCFRRVAAVAAQLSELAWWQGPEAASHRPAGLAAAREASPSAKKVAAAAGVAESSARPVASARLPAEGVAVASDAKVRQPEVAEVRPGLSAQQPAGAAEEEAVSAAQALPREEAAVELDVRGQPPEAAGVALDAAAELQPVGAAALPDAEARRPEEAVQWAAPVLRPAAVRPSALPSWRRGGRYLPGPAPRQAARSAHAMRRSRTASPSRRSLRAAGCGGLS